jgi:hypothetical protein
MEKTAEEIQLLKNEIEAWLKKHDLLTDTGWLNVDEHYGEVHRTFPFPHYLVLWFEGDLHSVIWSVTDDSDSRWHSKLGEFEAILKRHGCWFEREDNVTLCIMDRRERET